MSKTNVVGTIISPTPIHLIKDVKANVVDTINSNHHFFFFFFTLWATKDVNAYVVKRQITSFYTLCNIKFVKAIILDTISSIKTLNHLSLYPMDHKIVRANVNAYVVKRQITSFYTLCTIKFVKAIKLGTISSIKTLNPLSLYLMDHKIVRANVVDTINSINRQIASFYTLWPTKNVKANVMDTINFIKRQITSLYTLWSTKYVNANVVDNIDLIKRQITSLYTLWTPKDVKANG